MLLGNTPSVRRNENNRGVKEMRLNSYEVDDGQDKETRWGLSSICAFLALGGCLGFLCLPPALLGF